MSERKQIEERLRRKEQEILGMEEKIKVAKGYVQALRDILKILPSESETEAEPDAVLRVGSAVDQARRVILAKREPVHIEEILSAIGKDITREAKASLTSSLAAYVRRGEIFTRPAPNTFGLNELGHKRQEKENDEPPTDFGEMGGANDDIPF